MLARDFAQEAVHFMDGAPTEGCGVPLLVQKEAEMASESQVPKAGSGEPRNHLPELSGRLGHAASLSLSVRAASSHRQKEHGRPRHFLLNRTVMTELNTPINATTIGENADTMGRKPVGLTVACGWPEAPRLRRRSPAA